MNVPDENKGRQEHDLGLKTPKNTDFRLKKQLKNTFLREDPFGPHFLY